MGVKLQSALGGSVELNAPSTASNFTMTVPTTNGTLVTTDQLQNFRNLIINGDHAINQRGVTNTTVASGNNTTYTSDRWYSYGNGIQTTVTIQEVTLPNGTVVNSHKTTANAANSNSFLHPAQTIELLGKSYLRGKTITISTWVRTNLSNQRLRICDTIGCYELGSVIPNDGNWYYVQASYTLPTNMIISSASHLQIQPAFGSTNIPVGGYVEFTLMQVEVGSVATPFEFRPIAAELLMCQRYFERITIKNSGLAAQYSPNVYTGSTPGFSCVSLPFKVRKRATPSIPTVSTGAYWVVASSFAVSASATHTFVAFNINEENVRFVSNRIAGNNSPNTASMYVWEGDFTFDVIAEL